MNKSYQKDFLHRTKKKAVDALSFQVDKGEVFGIVGPNGAGKSTLLKILMGFISSDSGQAFVAGLPAGSVKGRQHLGYLPENPSLYSHLSIRDHLLFGCRVEGLRRSDAEKKINRVLHTVDLEYAAKMPIKKYSKGMTQRAALAYALLLEPEILILDEPMSGLDPLGRQMVVDVVHEYQSRGTTILFCSHILADVERICTRIGIMNRGRLAAVTTPGELAASSLSDLQPAATPLESFFLETIRSHSL
ncbi:MAG: ABC transporter ATP-binding protein [Desulfobulbaceae bacterium]|nr:ABC transporter ATP-binding protein [Desulfobulbaceae bacterium]